MSTYIGIDPGVSGGIAVIDDDRDVKLQKLEGLTERDIWRYLAYHEGAKCVIERLANMAAPQNGRPGRGSKANWSLSGSYHQLRMALIAAGIAFHAETPAKWQLAMCCRTKGDKNLTKAKAQQLYPGERITHATADALLLATYCKQHHHELF
jgi:hypothetical protein